MQAYISQQKRLLNINCWVLTEHGAVLHLLQKQCKHVLQVHYSWIGLTEVMLTKVLNVVYRYMDKEYTLSNTCCTSSVQW